MKIENCVEKGATEARNGPNGNLEFYCTFEICLYCSMRALCLYESERIRQWYRLRGQKLKYCGLWTAYRTTFDFIMASKA